MTDDDHTNDDEDDDDACDERRLSDGYAYSSRYAHRRSSGQYRRDLRYNTYAHSYAHSYTPSSYATYSYTPSTLAELSPPTSYDSEATILNEEPFVGEKDKQSCSWTGVLRRRRKDKGKEKEKEEVTREEDEEEHYSPSTSPIPAAVSQSTPAPEARVLKQDEYVPTCGEVFQRHWQTLCLAFNLSVFRVQRRMKHRVHSLMSMH
ncbi:hypothetical protein NP233_g10628 [Leucocoprinus birnbaumii]|uniref:Uncharacterized protein n=1 Tax=Leucocoprinus birnbaumii TaxID=56174 RepID=A0AAD5VI41_9AGAR|nr:hypothetical protein NP233_g10628 [Leucocoprinus birnbaumii]